MESVQVLTHCANDTNAEFERNILEILTSLKRFDTRTKETKPNMAKARKRLAFGANEVKKYMEVGKVLGLVIATNLNDDMLLGTYPLLTIFFY
jgi:ribosomal protein L7Ae-like RNA K-turn-binding protein